jgi:Domain of unknown function (DUF4062)
LTLIQRFISECDYYIVIVAGRYGSLGNDGRSYTEIEYDFAIEAEIPVLAFLHGDPSKIPEGRREPGGQGKAALDKFRRKIEAGRHANFWTSPKDLAGSVCLSMMSLMKLKPRIGWVHGDRVPDESAAQEILRLRDEVAELRSRLDQLATTPPANVGNLAQGEESISITFEGQIRGQDTAQQVSFTGNEVLAKLGPVLLNQANELQMKNKITEICSNKLADERELAFYNSYVRDEDFQRIKVQLLALGLIVRAEKPGYWTLTPYGITRMTQVAAIPTSRQKDVQP